MNRCKGQVYASSIVPCNSYSRGAEQVYAFNDLLMTIKNVLD
jgi:hypothetical protein